MKLIPDAISVRVTRLYRTFIQRPWELPLTPNTRPITLHNRPHKIRIIPSLTDPRIHNTDNGHFHAVDYPLPIGTPVVAVNNGEIIKFVDEHPDKKPNEVSNDRNINYLMVRDKSSGKIQFYAHLQQGSVSALGLKVGGLVRARQQISESGHNGESTAPHLHFGMYEENNNSPNIWGIISVPYKFDHW